MPDISLQKLASQLATKLEKDTLINQTVAHLRETLEADRVVLYYFYREWEGQVTFEALSSPEYSIWGSRGADECFNDQYAMLYLAGRVRAIADIEKEPIHSCHKNFLRSIQVRANLAVPILTNKKLWGLLVAHHCQNPRPWSEEDIETMKVAAQTLATSPIIHEQ